MFDFLWDPIFWWNPITTHIYVAVMALFIGYELRGKPELRVR